MTQGTVGIVYVPFRNKKHFKEVTDSWITLNYPKEKIIIYIVPNSDPENMISEIRAFQKEDHGLTVKLIEDGKNDGFAGNHNKGIRAALKDKCEFVYLDNGDLKLDPEAISNAVSVAESYPRAGAIQSLMLYWKTPDVVNAAGGKIHIAGYGYAQGNGKKKEEVNIEDGSEIAYASGGAVLYRAEALEEVGILEEGFFMYHEDLELGMRMRIAGWESRIAMNSITLHDYTFAINARMFEWMEVYRYVVIFGYWRVPTLILIIPALIGVELAAWVSALKGGWIGSKVKAALQFLKPSTWRLIIQMRARTKRLRKFGDRELMKFITGRIEAQEQSNWMVEKIANPILNIYTKIVKAIVIW